MSAPDDDALADLRNDYRKGSLSKADLAPEPERQLRSWLDEAIEAQVHEPSAMSVGTVAPDGQPFQRTVLLKQLDERGLVFFTNLESRKATHLEHEGRVSLLFFWPELERQVMVLGRAERVSRAEVLKYFASRPFASRLGAWVSPQSEIISSRSILEAKLAQMKARFQSGEVPAPDHWGGYRIVPHAFEFWQGGAGRLHDRFFYQREAEAWQIERLAP